VLTLRTVADSKRLASRMRPNDRVLVVGSGFIGCEIAASLASCGVPVTMLSQEAQPQVDRLGAEAARRIAGWLTALDVELLGEAKVAAVRDGLGVELENDRLVRGTTVVLATGVRPRGELASDAGLAMRDGAVMVDSAMRASGWRCAVLAVGDVAFAYNTTAARHLRVEHWGDAVVHGETAGRTLACGDGRWSDVPGFWSEIGGHTLKYAAWGDDLRSTAHADGAFTVWYARDGAAVGVLTHDRDEDYERGRALIAAGEPPPW
jgi:NADPH-dependent 2,4-dienoyl-CoA reductase/sulfur reductase-like enzyme